MLSSGVFCAYPVSYLTPLVILCVTVLLLTLILSPDLRGYGFKDPFAYHAVFMVLGFGLFMPLGVLVYVMDFGRGFNSLYPSRESRRPLHGSLLLLSAICIVIGYLIAFTCHQNGCSPKHPAQNHLPFWEPPQNSPIARSAHVVIGLLAIIGVVLQTGLGLYKAVQYEKMKVRIFPWHGIVGPFVWLFGITCIAIAAYFEYMEYRMVGKTAWTMQQMIVIFVALTALVVSVVSHLRFGTKRHILNDGHSPLRDEDEEEEEDFSYRAS